MTDPRFLRRDDLIGHRIVAIASRAWTEDGLDYDQSYLTLESGITFYPPLADFLPESTEIDPAATAAPSKFVSQFAGTPIAAMHAIQEDDGWIDPCSLLIELMDGRFLVHSTVEPNGTGAAGLRLYPKGHFDLAAYSDYWSLDRSQVAS